MIAADTSTWVAFLEGGEGEDTKLLDRALEDRQVVMVPIVLTELLTKRPEASFRRCRDALRRTSDRARIWLLATAGALRARVLVKRRKALLGDALIAQTCIDRGILFLTRDRDFRAFAEAAGPDLVLGPGTT